MIAEPVFAFWEDLGYTVDVDFGQHWYAILPF
jgi:hypothetical protein